MSSSGKNSFSPGTIIAGFRLESLIGSGAMASVYRAVQLSLERTVAVKILPADFARDEDFVERFFNEARAAAALSHANIVQAYDAGIADNDVCYFAMEYVEGENLLDLIEREGKMACAAALQIMLDMARALDYGWQNQRLNHGDLKPANIILNARGQAKLADFGLAKLGDFDFDADGIMLTPLYAAPELILGEVDKNDCRADIYSFGATLYHLLTGAPPFPGDDPEEVMDRQVNCSLTPVHVNNPDIPKPVSRLVDILLAKQPEVRPQSWGEVIVKLDPLLQKTIRGMAVAVSVTAHRRVASPEARRLARKAEAFRWHGKYPVSGKVGKRRRWWLLLIVMTAVAILVIYLYRVLLIAGGWDGIPLVFREATTTTILATRKTRNPKVMSRAANRRRRWAG